MLQVGGALSHYMQYWTFVVVSDIDPKSAKVSVEMKVTITERTPQCKWLDLEQQLMTA